LNYHTNIPLLEIVNRPKCNKKKVGRINDKVMTVAMTLVNRTGNSVGTLIKLTIFSEFSLVLPSKYQDRTVIRPRNLFSTTFTICSMACSV